MVASKTKKKKAGQPSKLDKINYDGLKLLAEHGFTDKQFAMCLSVTEQTINNWKLRDPEFFESLKDWKASADTEVEKSLYDRAKGWTDSTGKEYPPDPTSIIFWLKNRQRDKWRDKQDIDHTGKIGVEHTVKDGIDFKEITETREPSSKRGFRKSGA